MLAQFHAVCPFGVRYPGALPDLCILYVSFYERVVALVKLRLHPCRRQVGS